MSSGKAQVIQYGLRIIKMAFPQKKRQMTMMTGSNRNRKVFILNSGPHDYSEAAKFGDLVYCTDGELNKHDTGLMYRQLIPYLENADREDLIMINSLASLCSVAAAIMAANHCEVHFLIYNNGKYQVKDLVL